MSVTYQKHLLKYNLLYKNQSACRPNYARETALIITDRLLKEMDSGKLIGTILLYLSKESDLVNHDIPLSKLSMSFTSDHTMRWFKSYFSERSQTWIVSGKTSMPLPLVLGVPQGSILGLLFFSIYINDLPLPRQNSEIDMYADYTATWSSGNTCQSIQ